MKKIKSMKKMLISTVMIMALGITMPIASYAKGVDDLPIVYEELSTTPPTIPFEGGIELYGTNPPDKSSVYEVNQMHYVSGNAVQQPLYTNYCIYGASEITYSIVNDSSSSLNISLYYYGIGDTRWQKLGSTQTIAGGTKGVHTYTGLDTGTYYYLEFSGYYKDFHGFVNPKNL